MRNLSYAALALAAGLALSGAAQADEYISGSNREAYAVAAASAASDQSLLPSFASPTANAHQRSWSAKPAQIVGPFDNGDAHSGPAHHGSPAL